MVIMNNFQVKKNENGEYCLKTMCEHTELSYKKYYQKFHKEYITRDELNSIIRKNKDSDEVVKFEEKLNLIEENEWIKKVAVIIKDNNFDLQIDNLFIKLWTAFENQVSAFIISFLILKSIEFDSKNFEFNFDKQLSKFVKLLETNKVGDKTIRNFKSCIKSLNKCSKKTVKKYYTNFGKIFDCYKNNIAELKKQKLQNENQELKKKLNEKETQLNENNTRMNKFIHIHSSTQTDLDNIKTPIPDGYIYIATTNYYAENNIFKIGFTADLNTHIKKLNSDKEISTDFFYYPYYEKAFNVRKINRMIHDLLPACYTIPKTGYFRLHYARSSAIVDFIINNINKPNEHINEFVNHTLSPAFGIYNNLVYPFVPPEKEISDYNEFSESEIINAFRKIITHYGNSLVYEVKWKELESDFHKELGYQFQKKRIWELFKTEFNWKSSTTPICHEAYRIIVIS
ncbi:uncharacterized protein LOC130677311 [Microplitis mediator]|uniref:uncharacterized protein LOC130677311 n=1 Tax=Microplitis mediator TaxID=375433 RepID=UPI00255527C0|nr:uncharacterized protein LOC130677311 [Microplitis mediator]